MKRRELTNVEASVRQRLKNIAESTGRPFAELLQWYGIERFLARLAATEHAQEFVLKGAALLRVWDAHPARPTMDVDLGVPHVLTEDEVLHVVRECLEYQGEPDGLVFDIDSLEAQQIRIANRYPGIRVRFRGVLGAARIAMQVDVGFADAVVPPAVAVEYPSLLGSEPPRLRGYQAETVIAEKLEAIVSLGQRTSRMKDYFDIWWLVSQRRFGSRLVADAVSSTFNRRGTEIPETEPEGLSDRAISSQEKLAQWSAFVRRSQLHDMVPSFTEVVRVVREFAVPLFRMATAGSSSRGEWPPEGPWQGIGSEH